MLHGRLYGRTSRKNRISTTRALDKDQEEALLSYITVLDDAGCPLTAKTSQHVANSMLVSRDLSRTTPLT
jgi:hypothetical protein